ncbi:DUF1622 domain-containing protein [Methanolobus halotolerans]|uniref:DUF1622 domain-containing protein n=1 Tax=Methanolobus halotolerans TaxID=2052935 RepID=UPI001F193388|nr:DUF1622 domain-containing protein [Methanolobus halotolerans]
MASFGSSLLTLFETLLKVVGILLIFYGGVLAAGEIILYEVRKKPYSYAHIRRMFTDRILFGLEFLIAADVMVTVREPELGEILLLGAIVVIRSVLGYFLTKEMSEYHFKQ